MENPVSRQNHQKSKVAESDFEFDILFQPIILSLKFVRYKLIVQTFTNWEFTQANYQEIHQYIGKNFY